MKITRVPNKAGYLVVDRVLKHVEWLVRVSPPSDVLCVKGWSREVSAVWVAAGWQDLEVDPGPTRTDFRPCK